MDRRLTLVSSILYCLLPSLSFAQEAPAVEDHPPAFSLLSERIDLSLSDLRFEPHDAFLNSVTMRSLPQGSLYTRFDGLHGVVMRQLRGQARRFTRQALREGWYVDDETLSFRRDLLRRVDGGVDPLVNGAWWNRRWWESLPEEQGGAPTRAYVQTIGCENAWRLGPISASNTLKLRFDYLAFFEVDPDPIEPDHPERLAPVALDVRPIDEGMFGPFLRVDIRPRIQIGMPKDLEMTGLLRGAALRVSFEIWNTQKKLVVGDVSLRWRPEDGVSASFEVALASW